MQHPLPVVRMPEPVPPDPGGIDLSRVKRVDMAYPPGNVVATVTFRDTPAVRQVGGRRAEALRAAVLAYNRAKRYALTAGGA